MDNDKAFQPVSGSKEKRLQLGLTANRQADFLTSQARSQAGKPVPQSLI